MITIHFDYTVGEELSYVDGIANGDNFSTHCLEFFSTETVPNVIVRKKDGTYIDRNELMQNTGVYTNKEIRPAHNIRKMLIAGAFEFRKPSDKYHPVHSVSLEELMLVAINAFPDDTWKTWRSRNQVISSNFRMLFQELGRIIYRDVDGESYIIGETPGSEADRVWYELTKLEIHV